MFVIHFVMAWSKRFRFVPKSIIFTPQSFVFTKFSDPELFSHERVGTKSFFHPASGEALAPGAKAPSQHR